METQKQNNTNEIGVNSPVRVTGESVDRLSFTGRDSQGLLIWWNIGAPQSDRWEDHVTLGERCAEELMALIADCDQGIHHECLAFIDMDMQRKPGLATQGIRMGFMSAVSRALCDRLSARE